MRKKVSPKEWIDLGIGSQSHHANSTHKGLASIAGLPMGYMYVPKIKESCFDTGPRFGFLYRQAEKLESS